MREDATTYRYVPESGPGTRYTVPEGSPAPVVLIVSAGHGDIYGAPLADVNAIATARTPF